MAGMLVPWLHLAPNSLWVAVFGIGAAWFGWQALRTRGPVSPRLSRCRYPVPHLVECAAMIYMLLPGYRPPPGGTAMAMPGMNAASSQQGFPAIAVILALFMLGYIVWTTDRLTSRPAQFKTVTAGPARQLVPVRMMDGTKTPHRGRREASWIAPCGTTRRTVAAFEAIGPASRTILAFGYGSGLLRITPLRRCWH
jgi:hypothetical protein